ncbi:MAG: TrpB-like pyridoxal-phosphate dependent enzyme, partial [Desulfurococcaceae archaeon]
MDLKTPKYARAPQLAEIVPKYWYNVVPDLPEQLPPMLKPSGEAVKPHELEAVFPKKLIEQEFSTERFVEIPGELRELYVELGRPT